MSAIDTLLKASAIVGVTLASSAVAYHYVIYIPGRDAAAEISRRSQAESARGNERLRIEAQARKGAAEKLAEEQRKYEITARYDACIRLATVNYSDNWDINCKRVEEIRRKSHEDCLRSDINNQLKINCDTLHRVTPKGESCPLPTSLANGLNKGLEQSKNRCLQEMQMGLR